MKVEDETFQGVILEPATPDSTLPEFSGSPDDLTEFQREKEFLIDFWANSKLESTEFDAVLPQVIGYMPDEEREMFVSGLCTANSGDADPLTAMNTSSVSGILSPKFAEFFPGTHALIMRDLEATQVEPDGFMTKFLKAKVEVGKAQIVPYLHTDGALDSRNGSKLKHLSLYVVASEDPTEFYEGPITVAKKKWNRDIRDLDIRIVSEEGNIADRAQIVPAKPFQIVRITNLTMHRSPTATIAMTRSFLRIWCEQWKEMPR